MARPQIYQRNSSFFEKIDNQEKAYWLGYLYADGCVTKHGSSYVVSCNSIDKELLESLKSSIEYSGNVKAFCYGKQSFGKGNIYSLSINDRKIGEDLIKHGCFVRKTFILSFPVLSKKFRSHFIRGYFDGDGSVSLYFSKAKQRECVNISVSGTQNFLEEISKEVYGKIKFVYKDKRKSTDCWNLKINGDKSCLNFLDYIYKDSRFYLQRKKEKYDIFTKRFNDYNK